MAGKFFIGIDTSNYKTSVAAVDPDGAVVFERTELLEVRPGKRGLRQSEAFYQHSMRLPGFIDELLRSADVSDLAAIGYSSRPRRQEGSYMPCFNAGINTALTLSSVTGAPAYAFSHQEGHAAAIMPADEKEDCIFMHLSGGTTEFLLCRPDDCGYDMKIVGGTKDISFGQLLDRFGVAAGLPFPAGKYLDEISERHAERKNLQAGKEAYPKILPKIRIDDGYFNLSGAETRLMRFAGTDEAKSEERISEVCAEIFMAISDILLGSAGYLTDKYGLSKVYLAGGVASSKSVRRMISGSGNKDIIFGDPVLSGDNAVGTARLAAKIHP